VDLTRRHLLAAAAATPFALAARSGLAADPWRRTVVLVELNGGNDGLNTVIPYADPLYRSLRPKLAVPRDQILTLDEHLGLHPKLERLMPLWIDGQMAIALGVGYPNPNLSHFRSIDIWETATEAERFAEDGWIVRLLKESRPAASLPAEGVVLGRNDPGPLSGEGARIVALRRLKALRKRNRKPLVENIGTANPGLAHVVDIQNRMDIAERRLVERNLQAVALPGEFPKHDFGQQMEIAARLIAGGTGVPVIKCALGGFDTHGSQLYKHPKLLDQLAESLGAFSRAMKSAGLWDRVLVMTYAEFGRRPHENASGGTDHGTAAPHFLLGGRVRGGFYGEQPPLDRLQAKNLARRLDFREIYAAVARDWWGLKADFLKARALPLIS